MSKIVRAIKGDDIHGYADLNIRSSQKRLTGETRELAVEWFVEAVAEQTKFDTSTSYMLCPIPDSQCCSRKSDPKVMSLALALRKRLPQLDIVDALRWTGPIERRSRDKAVLIKALTCIRKIPDSYLILLDDVCTTGAHVLAAQEILINSGAKSMCGMSVAKTTLSADEEVFGFRSDPL